MELSKNTWYIAGIAILLRQNGFPIPTWQGDGSFEVTLSYRDLFKTALVKIEDRTFTVVSDDIVLTTDEDRLVETLRTLSGEE